MAALDPRWLALAARRLSPEEAAQLHAEACATPEGRDMWEAWQPLTPAEEEHLAGVALAQLAAERRRGRAGWEALAAAVVALALVAVVFAMEAHR
jgi:ferric-dicitrate binding protein FerR (iron transport regulator)